MAINANRSATAPHVPPTLPKNCSRGGRVLTAMAMTRALSPAKLRSRITMPNHRTQNSGFVRNSIIDSSSQVVFVSSYFQQTSTNVNDKNQGGVKTRLFDMVRQP